MAAEISIFIRVVVGVVAVAGVVLPFHQVLEDDVLFGLEQTEALACNLYHLDRGSVEFILCGALQLLDQLVEAFPVEESSVKEVA